MGKRGLNTIIKKNKLKAEEIFYVALDDYVETITNGEGLLSKTDYKKIQNSLKETTEEIKAYNKLIPVPIKGLFGELALIITIAQQLFLEAETKLKTLLLFRNEKRIKDQFIEILTKYYPKIVTEEEFEEEEKRRKYEEKDYDPDEEWIQDLAIYKPFNRLGKKDENIDERDYYKNDIDFYAEMLELTLDNVFFKNDIGCLLKEEKDILEKIGEFLTSADAYYNAIVIFSEKVKRPKLKELIDRYRQGVELYAKIYEIYHPTKTIETIIKPCLTPEVKITKAKEYANNTPLTELSIKRMVVILSM